MDTIPECILLRSDGIIGRMMKVSVGFFGTENLHVIATRLRYDIVCALTKSMSVSMGGKSGRLLFTFSFFSDFATIVVDSGCPFSFISVSWDSSAHEHKCTPSFLQGALRGSLLLPDLRMPCQRKKTVL